MRYVLLSLMQWNNHLALANNSNHTALLIYVVYIIDVDVVGQDRPFEELKPIRNYHRILFFRTLLIQPCHKLHLT